MPAVFAYEAVSAAAKRAEEAWGGRGALES